MTKRELSKYDFEALDEALALYIKSKGSQYGRAEDLRELFAKAHTGLLEIEEVD